MPLLDEVSAYLASNGIGTVGVDIFNGFRPDSPDSVTVLYETGGMAPVRAMRSAPGQPVAEQPRLQVICRDAVHEYAAARTKIGSIWALLEGLGDVTLSGTKYFWVGSTGSPGLMGRDDSGRVLLVALFDVIKDLS